MLVALYYIQCVFISAEWLPATRSLETGKKRKIVETAI